MLKRLRKALNRALAYEAINGRGRGKTYLHRWRLLATPWAKLYLHKFVGDDWTVDLHDHPKAFISIGLVGDYIEETAGGMTHYRAPWVRWFPAEHTHLITTSNSDAGYCWTLAIALRKEREWGFHTPHRNGHYLTWIPWRDYVDNPPLNRMSRPWVQ